MFSFLFLFLPVLQQPTAPDQHSQINGFFLSPITKNMRPTPMKLRSVVVTHSQRLRSRQAGVRQRKGLLLISRADTGTPVHGDWILLRGEWMRLFVKMGSAEMVLIPPLSVSNDVTLVWVLVKGSGHVEIFEPISAIFVTPPP
ncbi:hypothetical protein BC829DRAFT_143703 [Chytridium lagenaria]|nr:hypothetical protein BC829DRAFT_143703 [Chytridium lagenaria]